MKNIIIVFLFSIMVLFFASCENGVSFNPSDFDDDGTNTEIPDDDGDGDDGENETPSGTGIHSFKLDFTHISDSLPENFKFQPLQIKYAGMTDTTGKGITVTFNLSIDVPDVLEVSPPVTEDENVEDENVEDENVEDENVEDENVEDENQKEPSISKENTPPIVDTPLVEGDQNIKVTIASYEKKEGAENFPTAYFIDSTDNANTNLKEFTFTPENNTVELTVTYPNVLTMQRGTLPIKFTSDKFSDVYKNTMPRGLNLSVYSKGTAVTSRVVLDGLIEQTDDLAVEIFKPENDYILTIKDETKASVEQNKEIPLVLNLLGVKDGYPVTVSAKDSSNLDISNIVVENGEAKFTATHSGIKKFQQTEGTVTITVDSTHEEVYIGLPFDIVIKTKRDDSFKYYIDEYINNFSVSTSENNYFDNGYYTAVRIDGMNILEAALEDTLSYEIFRKDDSSTDFKSIFSHTVPANQKFVYKDRNAFILRNPEQEYKIKITHETCTNTEKCSSIQTTVAQKGSRLLTNRELFLVAMDSMRYALIDKGTHDVGFGAHDKTLETKSTNGGTFHHLSDYLGGWFVFGYKNVYTISEYKPHFLTLDGSFSFTTDATEYYSIDTVWDNGVHEKAPFTGTVNFNSPHGDGSIVFNNVNINNNTWSNPGWANGSFTVTVDGGKQVIYDNKGDVPFGFYMTDSEFLAKLDASNYTQQ